MQKLAEFHRIVYDYVVHRSARFSIATIWIITREHKKHGKIQLQIHGDAKQRLCTMTRGVISQTRMDRSSNAKYWRIYRIHYANKIENTILIKATILKSIIWARRNRWLYNETVVLSRYYRIFQKFLRGKSIET